MILFAYASNMNVDKFATSVPSAKKMCNAYLPGYSFIFNRKGDDDSAKANVIPCDELNAAVWGVLIEISDTDKHLFYHPDDTIDLFALPCIGHDGKNYTANVFISLPHATSNYLLPYDWYQQKLVAFARNQGLPDDYIHRIETMEHKIDPDEKRRAKQFKKKF